MIAHGDLAWHTMHNDSNNRIKLKRNTFSNKNFDLTIIKQTKTEKATLLKTNIRNKEKPHRVGHML